MAEADQYVKVLKAVYEDANHKAAELASLKAKGLDVSAQEQEVQAKLAAAKTELDAAKKRKAEVEDYAAKVAAYRGVELAEWAKGGLETALGFTPWAGLAPIVLGPLGALLAWLKKRNEVTPDAAVTA